MMLGKAKSFVQRCLYGAVLVATAGFVSERAAQAEVTFDDRSIRGSYAVVLTGGAQDGAALGLFDYDGKGGLSGYLLVNGPDSDVARNLFTASVAGTYSVNADGTGMQDFTLMTMGGDLDFTADLLITENNGRNAIEVNAGFQQPSPFVDGALVRFVMVKRLSDGFDDSSLDGVFAVNLLGGNSDGLAFGLVTYDGEGGLDGFLHVNGPGNDTMRGLFTTSLSGIYQVNDDGSVEQSWTFADGPMAPLAFEADMLITESNGRNAQRVNAQFREPSPFVAGALVTFELKRLQGAAGGQ